MKQNQINTTILECTEELKGVFDTWEDNSKIIREEFWNFAGM